MPKPSATAKPPGKPKRQPKVDPKAPALPSILSGVPAVPTNGNGASHQPQAEVILEGELEPTVSVPVVEEAPMGRKTLLPGILAKGNRIAQANRSTGNGEKDAAELMEEYNSMKELLDGGDPSKPFELDSRTEVNELQILHFARAEAMAEYYGIPILHDFVTNIKRLSISKNRKSRKEFVAAHQSSLYGQSEIQASGFANIGKHLGR
jgi:hypothetical protein